MLVAKDAIPLADELPITVIPREKYWTENYCYIGYDFETQVGLYLHIGRWLQDPTIWRECVYVYLPDGTTLNYRSLGKGDCSKGPQGALVKYECKEPGKLWETTFRGPTNHFTREDILSGGPQPERILEYMQMQVEFKAAGPIIQYEISDNSSIGRWHYEQELNVDAQITFKGRTYVMRGGQGWRDHTRGPRWLGNVLGHINFQGRLPDGRSFAAFQVWERRNDREVQIVDEARIIDRGKFTLAKIVSASRLLDVEQLSHPIQLTLQTDDERIELIGEPLNLMIYSNSPTFEILYGHAPALAPFVCFNQPVRWRRGADLFGGSAERTKWFGPMAGN
jgi:hypothetical protein